GALGRAARGHRDHGGSGWGAVRAHGRGDLGAKGGPVGVGHVPGRDDLVGDVPGQVGRYGKPDPLGLGAALRAGGGQRRDSDHLAGGGYQRPAAVARVDRRAGLDRVGQRRGWRGGCCRFGDRPAGRRDDALGDAAGQSQRGADGQHHVAGPPSPPWALRDSPTFAGVGPEGFGPGFPARSPGGWVPTRGADGGAVSPASWTWKDLAVPATWALVTMLP